MKLSLMADSQVTIVVVPRERFSFTCESLESIYEHTKFPFKLVYVDNNSPAKVRSYLEAQAQVKNFLLIQSDYYLSPNQARNVGLLQVSTKYVVFLDNDVVVSPGWLEALVACAEETEATVVGSLVCQHKPLHEIVHCAGGEYMPADELVHFLSEKSSKKQETKGKQVKRRVLEKIYQQGQRVADLRYCLQRQQTGFVEFHSVLVRTEVFKQIGLLDEKLSCTKEYLDLCMLVTQAGGTVYFEPASVVTFLSHFPAPPLEWSDIPYFMLRWSDDWEMSSLHHFRNKWGLAEDDYFKNRYKRLGWRRRIEIVKPLVAHLAFLGKKRTLWLERRLVYLEKVLNRYLTTRYARSQSQRRQAQAPTHLHKPAMTASSGG